MRNCKHKHNLNINYMSKMNPLSYTIKFALDTVSSTVSTYGMLSILPKTAVTVGGAAFGNLEAGFVNPLTTMAAMYRETNPESKFAIPVKLFHAASTTVDSFLSVNWAAAGTEGHGGHEVWNSVKEQCSSKEFWLSSGVVSLVETNLIGTHVTAGYAGANMINSILEAEVIAPASAAALFGLLDVITYLPGMVHDSIELVAGMFHSSDDQAKHSDM